MIPKTGNLKATCALKRPPPPPERRRASGSFTSSSEPGSAAPPTIRLLDQQDHRLASLGNAVDHGPDARDTGVHHERNDFTDGNRAIHGLTLRGDSHCGRVTPSCRPRSYRTSSEMSGAFPEVWPGPMEASVSLGSLDGSPQVGCVQSIGRNTISDGGLHPPDEQTGWRVAEPGPKAWPNRIGEVGNWRKLDGFCDRGMKRPGSDAHANAAWREPRPSEMRKVTSAVR